MYVFELFLLLLTICTPLGTKSLRILKLNSPKMQMVWPGLLFNICNYWAFPPETKKKVYCLFSQLKTIFFGDRAQWSGQTRSSLRCLSKTVPIALDLLSALHLWSGYCFIPDEAFFYCIFDLNWFILTPLWTNCTKNNIYAIICSVEC